MTALTQSRQRHQDFPTRPVLNPAIPIMELSEGCLQVGHTAQKRFSGYAAHAIRAALAKLTVESQPDPDDDLGWEGMWLLNDAEALQDCHRPHTWSLRDSADRERLRGLTNSMPSYFAAQTIAARQDLRIAVTAPSQWSVLEQTLQELELKTTTDRSAADIAVVVGSVGFQQISSLMRNEIPHLAISPRTDSIRVGPLVVPGATPCLQCLYLTRCDRDEEFLRVSLRLEQHGSTEIDHLLMHQAAALAARLTASCADWLSTKFNRVPGPKEPIPANTGKYWTVVTDTPEVKSRSISRHPRCSCWWEQLQSHDLTKH